MEFLKEHLTNISVKVIVKTILLILILLATISLFVDFYEVIDQKSKTLNEMSFNYKVSCVNKINTDHKTCLDMKNDLERIKGTNSLSLLKLLENNFLGLSLFTKLVLLVVGLPLLIFVCR